MLAQAVQEEKVVQETGGSARNPQQAGGSHQEPALTTCEPTLEEPEAFPRRPESGLLDSELRGTLPRERCSTDRWCPAEPNQVISHYRIIEKLGEGGMGIVYKAEDIKLGRLVALKFPADPLAKKPSEINRLKAEARAASSLNHPSICTIYDIDEADGRWFIVMECLEGQTLAEVTRKRVLPLSDVLKYTSQICDALAAAHRRGIVHGDVKPSNVFVTQENRIKLLDFGLSKAVAPKNRDDDSTDRLDGTRTVSGTLQYMSPEQARGLNADHRSDIFSFGVVCYELITGFLPFQGDTPDEILVNVIAKKPVVIGLLRPHAPADLEKVVLKCLEKRPELRYQRADILVEELRVIRRKFVSRETTTGVNHNAPQYCGCSV